MFFESSQTILWGYYDYNYQQAVINVSSEYISIFCVKVSYDASGHVLWANSNATKPIFITRIAYMTN